MNSFAPAVKATRCSGGPTPGAKALLAYLLDRYSYAESQGIYNCRKVRGGNSRSTHSEGRAVDLKIPVGRGGSARPELGDPVVRLLASQGKRLGIQRLIYNRQSWSAAAPSGKHYGGKHPHFDHVHIELTPQAAAALNYATLEAVLGNGNGSRPRNSGKANAALIDAAFAAGWAQGQKSYWHDLPADSPEWGDFWGACYRAAEQVTRRGKPAAAWIDAAFAAGWAQGQKSYWHNLAADSPEWSDFWTAFTVAVG